MTRRSPYGGIPTPPTFDPERLTCSALDVARQRNGQPAAFVAALREYRQVAHGYGLTPAEVTVAERGLMSGPGFVARQTADHLTELAAARHAAGNAA